MRVLHFGVLAAALASCAAPMVSSAATVTRFDLLPQDSLTARPGDSVSFWVVAEHQLDHFSEYHPGYPEPAWPAFGEQSWFTGSEYYRYEWLNGVTLNAWTSAGTSDSQYFDRPGGGMSWNFNVSFAVPGSYTVSAGGYWDSGYSEHYYSNYNTRFCVFFCGAWESHPSGYNRQGFYSSGAYPTRTLTVTVVPEPGSGALMLGGVALLCSLRQRRWHLHGISSGQAAA